MSLQNLMCRVWPFNIWSKGVTYKTSFFLISNDIIRKNEQNQIQGVFKIYINYRIKHLKWNKIEENKTNQKKIIKWRRGVIRNTEPFPRINLNSQPTLLELSNNSFEDDTITHHLYILDNHQPNNANQFANLSHLH